MANIRKRGSRWQVQVRRQGHRSLTKSFLSRKDAETWGRLQEGQIDRVGLPPDPRALRQVTLASLLERYATEVTPRKRSAPHEGNRIARLLRHPMARLPVSNLGPSVFKEFRDERLASVGPQAVRHDLNLLSHVIRVAMQEWELPLAANPLNKVDKPSTPHSRERRLRPGEWEALESEASRGVHPRYLLGLLHTAVETGMRKGELLALRRADIDVGERTAQVRQSKNGHPRTVPLSPVALAAILDQPESQPTVFATGVAALRFHWDRLLAKVGTSDLHFHDLRHEAISRFFERGLSIPEVALISGHRDVRQLFRYTHPRAEDLVKKLWAPSP